ncbi:MAG TPA: Rrf2 family transcriptional regulator [Candidatus Omnitrophica bacterium]|nr:MAG: hypothetical protein DRP69_02705 [Candidatus Omnitrophota bacterium]RKY43377.1 MAG: hypothetical protein DRP80_05425 [Candidatus Omnitrophota bacterium]HEC69415.1 Rrf2 family transcriptional regulator [Candidatus Omnitrophota bacterium]
MRISARCDYACRALLELALHWPSKSPLSIHTISKNQNIPMKYLVHILLQLKRMSLVESIRGKEGGYILKKSPNNIRLGEVMEKMGEPLLSKSNISEKEYSFFFNIWREIGEEIEGFLNKITFEDIVNRVQGLRGVIVYQI